MSTFGERLREARKKNGLQQNILAGRMRVSPQQIWQLEHDKRSPKIGLVRELARVLEVGVDWLESGVVLPLASPIRSIRLSLAVDTTATECGSCAVPQHSATCYLFGFRGWSSEVGHYRTASCIAAEAA